MSYKCTLESKEKGYHHTQVLDVPSKELAVSVVFYAITKIWLDNPSKHELIFGKKTWLEIARMVIENTVEVES